MLFCGMSDSARSLRPFEADDESALVGVCIAQACAYTFFRHGRHSPSKTLRRLSERHTAEVRPFGWALFIKRSLPTWQSRAVH